MRLWYWPGHKPSIEHQIGQIMATLADVNTALDGLATSFAQLQTQATTLYNTLKSQSGVTPAQLDAVVARIAADTATVNSAITVITTPPVAA